MKSDLSIIVAPLRGAFDAALYGTKASNIARLFALGINVPVGFVVSHHFFKILSPQKRKKILSEEIRHLTSPLTVRSSANLEDSRFFSFAGQYRSVSWLRGSKNILKAVQLCRASARSRTVLLYCHLHGIAIRGVSLSVIIQEMVRTVCSGVLFTQHPITGSRNQMMIEYVPLKDNSGVVSSGMQPNRLVLDKSLNRGDIVRIIDSNRTLSDVPNIYDLFKQALIIEEAFGYPQDIEWGIGVDGLVWFFQSRPIPNPIIRSIQKPVDILHIFQNEARCECISSGLAYGHTYKMSLSRRLRRVPSEGTILLIDEYDVSLLPMIFYASGVILRQSGLLSHLGVVLRELSIPCVANLPLTVYDKLSSDRFLICIDAKSGNVYY